MTRDDRAQERLRWRSRRGLLEMDLILQRFMARHLAALEGDDLTVYDTLLDLPDNDFLDLAMGRREPDNPAWQPVLQKIRES